MSWLFKKTPTREELAAEKAATNAKSAANAQKIIENAKAKGLVEYKYKEYESGGQPGDYSLVERTKWVSPEELLVLKKKNQNAKNSAAAAEAEMKAKRVAKLKSVAELTIPKLNTLVETLNSLSTQSDEQITAAVDSIKKSSNDGELHLQEIQRLSNVIRTGYDYGRSFIQGGGKRLTKKRKTRRN